MGNDSDSGMRTIFSGIRIILFIHSRIKMDWFRNQSGMIPESKWFDSGIKMEWFRKQNGLNPESHLIDSALWNDSMAEVIRNQNGLILESKWNDPGIKMDRFRNQNGWIRNQSVINFCGQPANRNDPRKMILIPESESFCLESESISWNQSASRENDSREMILIPESESNPWNHSGIITGIGQICKTIPG